MTSLRAFLLIPIALIASSAASAADPLDGIDDYLKLALAKWEIPGLAIAVVKDGEVVLARGYGVCEIGADRPVTPDTVFSIASCTKSFTAASVAMLVDDGKVNWDDQVRKHVPSFAVADPYVSEHATLRDLLCHRTGLVLGDLLLVKGEFSPEEVLRRAAFLEQAVPFRTKFTYHNIMYGFLGRTVAEMSAMSWDQFVTERIFEPLEMKSTTTVASSLPASRRATRHRLYDGKVRPLQTRVYDHIGGPAGAIHSTVIDMAKWLKLQLREGEYEGGRLLQADTMREMHAIHQSIPVKVRPDANVWNTKFVGYGLGWFVREYRGLRVVQHGGAWGAETAFIPQKDLAIVVLSNLDNNGLVWLLLFDVIDAYLDGPQTAWSQDKWERWLPIGGPGVINRGLERQKSELEKERVLGTKPSLALADYSGAYESTLYGSLYIDHQNDRLSVRFGDHAGELVHWQDDMFYGHAIVEPFFDWLVKFDVGPAGKVRELEVVGVGWIDPDERHFFKRKQ